MRIKKILVIILIFIIIFPSISSNTLSQEENTVNKYPGFFLNWITGKSNETFFHYLLKQRFNLGFITFLSMGRYFYQQQRPPTPIQAFPESVSLEYLNQTNFQIGGKNENHSKWVQMIRVANGYNFAWMNKRTIFSFEFVPPENISNDIWNVQFEPEYLILDTNTENLNWHGATTPFKTNVTIMLKPSVDPSIFTQDTVLKVNIWKEEVLDKLAFLKGSPKFLKPFTNPTAYEEFLQKCDGIGEGIWWNKIRILEYNIFVKYVYLFMNWKFPFVEKKIDSTVEILIKVEKYHLAEIEPPLPIQIEPYQIKSIPITIRNLGSHIDSYNFRVRCDDENMIVIPPAAITLRPGEEAQALVGVASPRTFSAAGSSTSIYVEAYSVDNPETIFKNTIILETSGITVTGGAIYSSVLLIITLLIIIALFFYLLNKYKERICKKPDKPWKIPEEKKYLEKLDKKEYSKELEMMKQEYESSLLWYKYYYDAIVKKKKAKYKEDKIKQKAKKLEIKKELKKEKKKLEEEELEKKKEEIPEIKEKIQTQPKKEEEKPLINKEFEKERIKKIQAILKIRREQEKQKKKIKA